MTRSPGFNPCSDDPEGADALADLDLSKVHGLVGSDHRDLVDALHILDGPLRNEERAFLRVDDRAHLRVLAGAQEIARVREYSPDVDGAGRLPDRAVQDRDRPPVGVTRPVGQGDLEVVLPLAVTAGYRAALAKSQILLLADRELDVDRIDLGDRGENRAGRDQVADVRVLDPGDAGDRGEHLRPAVVELGIVQHGPGLRDVRLIPGHPRLRVREARAGGLQRGQIRQVGLHRVIQLLLADRAARRQRGVAADVELRVLLVRLGPGHVRLGLRDLGHRLLALRLLLQELCPGLFGGDLIRPGVDLEQEVAGLDARPFLVGLAHEVAGDPGADLRGDVPDRGAHPLAVDRYVLLDHRLDLDRGRWRWPGGGGRIATTGRERRDRDDEQAEKGVNPHCASSSPGAGNHAAQLGLDISERLFVRTGLPVCLKKHERVVADATGSVFRKNLQAERRRLRGDRPGPVLFVWQPPLRRAAPESARTRKSMIIASTILFLRALRTPRISPRRSPCGERQKDEGGRW